LEVTIMDVESGGDEAQGRGRRASALIAGGAAVALALPVATALAALRVRRMRREARALPDLLLDLELAGIMPERTVVTLGDSSSAGFRLTDPEQSASRRVARALHLRDGRATRLRSVARNGATTADVLADQVEAVAGAELVLIGVGANDAKDRIPIGEVEAALDALLVRVRELAAPGARVVMVGCPDLSVAPSLPFLLRVAMRPLARRVARLQERVAAEHGVAFVPLPRMQLGAEVFADDGFHPGPLGHERVAARILAIL
jgi:lysophospholipase L1-like esterase